MIEDSKERIYICSEEELFISIFKNFTDEKLCTYIKENLFVLASKQNRRITTGNLLSYKEHKLRLRKKKNSPSLNTIDGIDNKKKHVKVGRQILINVFAIYNAHYNNNNLKYIPLMLDENANS